MKKKLLVLIIIFIGLLLNMYIWLKGNAKDVILSSEMIPERVINFYKVILDRKSFDDLQIEILKDKKNLNLLVFSRILKDIDSSKKCHLLALIQAYHQELKNNYHKEYIEIKTIFGVRKDYIGMYDKKSFIDQYINSINTKCGKNEKIK